MMMSVSRENSGQSERGVDELAAPGRAERGDPFLEVGAHHRPQAVDRARRERR
jgi:hypothetical protein